MPKVGTAYVSIRARLDKLEKDLSDGKRLSERKARETQQSVSRIYKSIVGYFGAQQILRFGEAIFDTGRQVARLDKAFAEITGSTSMAGKEFDFLRETADELGQNFYDLAGSYKGLLAASRGTVLEGRGVRDIFHAITKATTTLGLSSEDVKLSLYAVEQMMSKGKVSAEELRRQLGERLPGAFSLAAQAIGVSTTQLDKMLKDGKLLSEEFLPKFADLLEKRYSGAVDDATRASNKLSEAWTDLKTNVAQSGFMESIVGSAQDLADALKDPAVQRGLSDFADNVGYIVESMAELTKYAGTRSVWHTLSQGVELAKQGLIDWDEFTKAGFHERQMMVDDILKKQKAIAEVPDNSSALRSKMNVLKIDIEAMEERIRRGREDLTSWRSDIMGSDVYEKQLERDLKNLDILKTKLEDTRRALATSWSRPQLADFARSAKGYNDLWLSALKDQPTGELDIPEFTDKELKAFAKSAKGYVDLWKAAADEKYQVMSRSYDDIVALDEQAAEYERRRADARISDRKDFWQIQAEERMDVQSRALDAMAENENRFAEDIKSATAGWASNFSDALNDLVWDSETSFDKILESFGRMITQMLIQKKVVEPLLGSMGASVQHAGGPAGSGPRRQVPSWIFAGAPRLHSGLAWDEYPAILQRGESVIPKGKSGKGGIALNINIINNAGVQVTQRERETPQGPTIDIMLDQATANKINQKGSATNRALRARGAEMPLVRR